MQKDLITSILLPLCIILSTKILLDIHILFKYIKIETCIFKEKIKNDYLQTKNKKV